MYSSFELEFNELGKDQKVPRIRFFIESFCETNVLARLVVDEIIQTRQNFSLMSNRN